VFANGLTFGLRTHWLPRVHIEGWGIERRLEAPPPPSVMCLVSVVSVVSVRVPNFLLVTLMQFVALASESRWRRRVGADDVVR